MMTPPKGGTLPTKVREDRDVILTAVAAEPANFGDQSGMNTKVSCMLSINDAGGSSLYHAAMLRRKEADDHAAKLLVSPALSVGDIVACRAGQRTIHSLEESGRVAIKLAASGGLVTYNSRGKK